MKHCLKWCLSAAAFAVSFGVRAAEPCYVDVLIAVDQAAQAYVEDECGSTLEDFAAHQVAGMNTVLTNSGLSADFAFRSVGVYKLGFKAIRLDETKYLTRDVLEQATGGLGQWAQLHNERDNRGADIVSVVVDTGDKYGHCGDGNALTDLGDVAGFSESAYSVVGVRSTGDWHAMLHEIGHNMGAGHAGGTDQSAAYSHGYYFNGTDGKKYFTVMGYLKYDEQAKPYVEAPVFSSPNVTWAGTAAGDAATADNVRVLRQTCQAVSQWRKAADEPPEGGVVGPYMTVSWHQHSPYNDFAAICGSEKAPCGCAATAAGQMFRYYSWPVRLDGVVEGAAHKYVGGVSSPFTLRFDGHNDFQWAKMNDYASQNDVVGNFAAARATLWCDTVGAMDFRPGDSSAQFSTMAEAVTAWYEKGRSYSYTFDGPDVLWNALAVSLNRKEPVQVMLNGHQVVADGYSVTGGVKKVHINWGTNDGNTRWYGWSELRNIGIKEFWAGCRPKKTVQMRPLPKKKTAGILTVSWDAPPTYASDITGFTYTTYLTTSTKNTYTGEAGTIAKDCADCYYQPGVFGITASSKFDYTMTSYYVKGLTVELQARFDAGEWETIDTPTLSDKEDSKDGSGEVVYNKTVDLSAWTGKEAEFRFKASRTGASTTSSARIAYSAPKVKDVYMPIATSNTIPGGSGVRAFNSVTTSSAGKVLVVRITPQMKGGVASEPMAVKLTADEVPAQPSIASVESLSSPITDGFRRTCGLGKSVFFVKVNGTTADVTASSSHLALVDDAAVSVKKLDDVTWAVAIDAPQETVPQNSQLILTLCAEDEIGNKSCKDLQLTFKSGEGGAEPEDTLAEKIADGNFLYLPSGTSLTLPANDTHYVAGNGTVVFDGGLPSVGVERGFDNQDSWHGTVKFVNFTPTAEETVRINYEFKNVNSRVEFGGAADPNVMYHNALNANDEEVKVARGTYGDIEVPAYGYYATAFDALTTLGKTADNTYADIIKDGTYVDTHTVAGWFKVGVLPTGTGLRTLYMAKSCDQDHNGYKVAVDAAGRVLVGKTNYGGGEYPWNGSNYKVSDAAAVTAGKWFHLAVAIAKTAGVNTVTPTLFVNGEAVALAAGTFACNLNGNGCTDLMVGADVTAAGIVVDKRALDDASAVAALATDFRYVVPGSKEMPDPEEPVTVPDPTHWYKFDGNLDSSGTTALAIADSERAASYVASLRGQAYRTVNGSAHPYGSGVTYGEGAYTLFSLVKSVDAENAVLWCVGNNAAGLGLFSGGGDKVYVGQVASKQLTRIGDAIEVEGATSFYHAYALVVEGTSVKFYVDGALAATGTKSVTAGGNFQWGGIHGGINGTDIKRVSDVCLDDWRLYQQALTDAQIAKISRTTYSATLDADKSWSGLVWSPAKPDEGFGSLDSLVVTAKADGLTLTLDEPVTCAVMRVTGEGMTTAVAGLEDYADEIGLLDIDADSAVKIAAWANAGSKITGAGTLVVDTGAKATEFQVSGFAYTGAFVMKRGTWNAATAFPQTRANMFFDGVDALMTVSGGDKTGYGNGLSKIEFMNGATLRFVERDTFSRELVLRNGSHVVVDAHATGRGLDFFSNSKLSVHGAGMTSTIGSATPGEVVGSGVISLRRDNFEMWVEQGATLDVYSQWGFNSESTSLGRTARKTGLGTVAFYRATPQTGAFTVEAGTLKLVDAGAPTTGTIALADGAALVCETTAGVTQTLTTVTGDAAVTVRGAGTTKLTSNLANCTVEAGATLDLNGHTVAKLAGMGTVYDSTGTVTLTFAGTFEPTLKLDCKIALADGIVVNAADEASLATLVGANGSVTALGKFTVVVDGSAMDKNWKVEGRGIAAQPFDAISVNVKGGNKNRASKAIAADNVAGVVPMLGSQWSQVLVRSNASAVDGMLDAGDAIVEIRANGKAVTNAVAVTPYAACCYTAQGASTPVSGNGELMYGYLDDGEKHYAGKGASFDIANIPYTEYTLYVYFGTDQGDASGKKIGPVYVNGTAYPSEAGWGSAAALHENGTAVKLVEGQNFIKVTGLTDAALSIVGSKSSMPANTRCGIAGFQIINTGTRRAMETFMWVR